MANFKPTHKDPISPQSEKFEKDFNKTMVNNQLNISEGEDYLLEVDGMLSEAEQTLKKKIFSLAKMESLVFSDPKLSAVYEDMADNGEEKYGYHYNETIQNMIFNDYVLNSPHYLQKYKMAIPKEKKRRDKSGINKLKKVGMEKMAQTGLPKPKKEVSEGGEPSTKVVFLIHPNDEDIFAYFPEENYDTTGKFKTGYSHVGQHSAVSPNYAAESRQATPEEYQNLKAELEGQGYELEVLNGMQESTSAGSAGGAAGYVGYAGPAAWSTKGDLLGGKKKAKPIDKPIWKGGTVIQESNYLTDSTGFEKYVEMLNEEFEMGSDYIDPIAAAKTSGRESNFNSEWKRLSANDFNVFKKEYGIPDDVWNKMSSEDKKNELDNYLNINEIAGVKTDMADQRNQANAAVKGKAIDGVIDDKIDDKENDYMMNNKIKEQNIGEGNNPDMYSTKEDLKNLVQSLKQQTGKGLTKEHIPMLAGEALYTIAIQLANRLLPMNWDDLGDINSMWDYIDENGGMTYEDLVSSVKEACDERLSEEGMGLDDLEETNINEKAKSKSQQRFMGMVHAVQKGKLSPDKVSGSVEKAAETMTDKDAEDFASTKHKGLPNHVDEYLIRDALIGDDIVDIQPRTGEEPFMLQGGKYQYETATFADGRKDLVVYSFGDDVYYDYMKFRKAMGIDESLDEDSNKNKINPKYTHFAIYKPNGKIINGWEYKGYDPEELKMEKKHYFFNDIVDMDFQPKEVNVLTLKILQKRGINPFDINNWYTERFNNDIKEDTQTMIQNNGTSMSNKAQATGDQSSEVPVGMQATGGLNEADNKLLEEIDKELEAFSIHHNKLKVMSEERKTTSQILNKRVTDDNPKNFKKDLQHSGTKEILDVEKELEWKDQQTDVPKDPQKLGMDIEKQALKTGDMKSEEAFKNVGNSTNDKGDEVPKRNLTTKEQEEVNLYRNGLHSLVYDNEPDERFEERMKADMGDEIYEMRKKQLEFKGKAPMYNKDPQPIEDTTAKKVQFDKEQTDWNERMGIGNEKSLKESMVTGSYRNAIGDRHLIDFNLSEAVELKTPSNTARQTGLFELDTTGLGNTYNSKTVDNKVIVNEAVAKVLSTHKFFTDGKKIFRMKNPVQNLTEGEKKNEKPVMSEEFKKMQHLLGYKPDSYVNTKNVKKNRGF